MWTEVIRLLEDPTLITAELDRRLAAAHATEPIRRRQEALERERVQASKAMERLVNAYQEDLLSLEELRHRMPDLRRREQGAKAQLQSIADQTAERTATLRLAESLSAFLTRLRTRAQTLDIHERQRIVRLLVKEVLIADNTIVIRHSIPIHAPHPGDSDPPPPPPEGRSPLGDQNYLLCPRRDAPPCGVPRWVSRAAVVRSSPPPSTRSTTGASSHWRITASTLPSATRRATERSRSPCGMLLK